MNPPIRPFSNAIAKETGCRWPVTWISSSRGYFNGRVSLGNMTELEVFICFLPGEDGMFFGVSGHGCYRFNTTSYKNWDYIGTKLMLCQSDAKNMADFMNHLTHVKAQDQGRYDDRYCQDED